MINPDMRRLKTGDIFYYILADSVHIFTITSEFKEDENGFNYHSWSYYSSEKKIKNENKTMYSSKWLGSAFRNYAVNIDEDKFQKAAFFIIFD